MLIKIIQYGALLGIAAILQGMSGDPAAKWAIIVLIAVAVGAAYKQGLEEKC